MVPFNSFAEYAPEPNPDTQKKDVAWFALHDDRPLTAFAGIWTTFNGDRGIQAKRVPGPHKAYGFLTTPRNRAAKAGLNLQGRCQHSPRAAGFRIVNYADTAYYT